MAGDWIKMRADLLTSPKVVRIASALRADRLRVIGGLHAVWCLFDVHSDDGVLDGYTTATLDEMIGWQGFGDAMCSVQWLLQGVDRLEVPRFDEHNGQSAKRRAQEAQRKRKERAESSAPDADKKRTRGEKRRSKKPPSPLPGGFVAFWNAWPQHHRKAAKPQCARKWEKDGCEAMAAQIVAAVTRSKRSEAWTKNGGEFIPAPLVWLNQARWDAPPETAGSITVPSEETGKTAELLAKMAETAVEAQSPEAQAARKAAMAKLGKLGRIAA